MKNFKLKDKDIKQLVSGLGGGVATDRITVDGYPINFMYRDKPVNDQDSGWCFFSGIDEDDEYLDSPDNSTVFDLNTIANYDETIIPYLEAPFGSVFERSSDTGEFIEVHDFEIPGFFIQPAPEITNVMREEAKHRAGGYIYCIDPAFVSEGPDGNVPREVIIGAYPVDSQGIIVEDFQANPYYKAS